MCIFVSFINVSDVKKYKNVNKIFNIMIYHKIGTNTQTKVWVDEIIKHTILGNLINENSSI